MSGIDQVLAVLAQRTDGLVVARDARAAGLTDRQLRTRCRSGVLRRLYPGVYAHEAVPGSERQRWRAVLAASGGVLSHRSAAYLHGLYRVAPAQPEITVPPSRFFRPEGVIVHRHDVLDEIDVMDVDGLAATTPVRTLVDLGTHVSFATLCRAFERGLRDGHFTYADAVRTRSRLARRGRDGVGPLRLLLDHRAADLAPTESDLEQLLWDIVERHDLPVPRRQVAVVLDGAVYRIDVAYPDRQIAIEGDGFGVHTERRAFERDRARQNALVLAGWLVLRFTWQQLIEHEDHVARTIRRALDARPPSSVRDLPR